MRYLFWFFVLFVLPFLYLSYRLFVPSAAAQRDAESWPRVPAKVIKVYSPGFGRRRYRWVCVDCAFIDGMGRTPPQYGRGCMVKDLRDSSLGDERLLLGAQVTVRVKPQSDLAMLELSTLGSGIASTPDRRFAPFMNDSRDGD